MKNNTNTQPINTSAQVAFAELKMNEDLKHSILIVSLVINLVVLTAWVALQVTTLYDAQIAGLLFSR
ncbi:MAG: hypothetical protein JWM07_211 [Candidatus Saccharibacteria bacterium]|nr:hypothetical protein [Candidatus Saccharibacteria bacterium]